MTANDSSLTQAQISLLNDLKTDYNRGLPYKKNSKGTSCYNDVGGGDGYQQSSTSNQVSPPINCPKWVCCLLPCLQHIPKMKLFRSIQPEDAEVRRDGEWIIYDANTLLLGDIIRLRSGDRVPADCVLLSLGAFSAPKRTNTTNENDITTTPLSSSIDDGGIVASSDAAAEMVVDESQINGKKNPKTITNSQLKDEQGSLIELYYGSQILHGKGIAVVTAVGVQTLLASLIRRGKWPPNTAIITNEEDEEVGLSLVNRSH